VEALQMTGMEGKDLYGGMAGIGLECDDFEFGEGITISRTYAHLMAPLLMAFAPAPTGGHHPAPWKAVRGGMAFDIVAEIHVPANLLLEDWFDQLNTIWWIAALMRLRVSPLTRVPVIAARPLSTLSEASEAEATVWPIEVNPSQLVPVQEAATLARRQDLEWIAAFWLPSGRLVRSNENLNTAFQAFDQCIWTISPALALVQLWGALERIFTTAHHQKTLQLSSRISAYLESDPEARAQLAEDVVTLYRARSSCAHGNPTSKADPLYGTYALLRRVLFKIIEQNHVPSTDELEKWQSSKGTRSSA
jgi:hypothetical protein